MSMVYVQNVLMERHHRAWYIQNVPWGWVGGDVHFLTHDPYRVGGVLVLALRRA